jgi:hypothetical protein
MKILSIGMGKKSSSDYEYCCFNQVDYPTIFDYDLVIVNLPTLERDLFSHFALTKPDFEKFFESGGICFVVMAPLDQVGGVSNYDWCPFSGDLKVNNRSGTTLEWIDKKAKSAIGNLNFSWDCYFSGARKPNKVLATNRTNDPVSIAVSYRNGVCVFLPRPAEQPKRNSSWFHEFIVRRGLEIVPEFGTNVDKSLYPSWANSVATKREIALAESLNEIDEELGKYTKFKQLHWEFGGTLKNLVTKAFKEFGFDVTELPKESGVDFEVALQPGLTGAFEVKGLSGNVTIQDLSQLLEYCVKQKEVDKRNVKGIFIVNHYRSVEPSRRGNPATKDALDLMTKNGLKLLTVIQLFDLLEKFWAQQLRKEELANMLTA